MQVIKNYSTLCISKRSRGEGGIEEGKGQDAAVVAFWCLTPARYSETPAHKGMCQIKTSNSNNTLSR